MAGRGRARLYPYPDRLRRQLLDLQDTGTDELHRSRILSQELSRLYAQTVGELLNKQNLAPSDITALGCHGQTVRHAPEHGYSIQLADLPLLAERTRIFTVGDFRSRDLAAGGQGAPLVPAFHEALFRDDRETRAVLNIGGIANISVLPRRTRLRLRHRTGQYADGRVDAGTLAASLRQKRCKGGTRQHIAATARQAARPPVFRTTHPKSTGRELFALNWLETYLDGGENRYDVLRTLSRFTAQTVFDAVSHAAADARQMYICGGGIRNPVLMADLAECFGTRVSLHSTAELNLDPQWVEAAAFAWMAACWVNRIPGSPHKATGASKPCILGAGYYY